MSDAEYMKAAIVGGDVVRRRVMSKRVTVGMGQIVTYKTPELYDGEILCDRIGLMPLILTANRTNDGDIWQSNSD